MKRSIDSDGYFSLRQFVQGQEVTKRGWGQTKGFQPTLMFSIYFHHHINHVLCFTLKLYFKIPNDNIDASSFVVSRKT